MPTPNDHLRYAVESYVDGAPSDVTISAALVAIAQELRTANLLTAATVLHGEAGSIAAELASERLDDDPKPIDEKPGCQCACDDCERAHRFAGVMVHDDHEWHPETPLGPVCR